MSLILGIDTSNYTTSAAVYDSDKKIMIQQKKLLPVKEGQLGLRQSDAVFHHTQRLHLMIENLCKDCNLNDIKAIGVSSKPRPVEGSYMPCFTVGQNTAKILSAVLNVPLFEFSHQEGHISAAIYSSENFELFDKRFIAFHISGGTTEAVLATPDDNYSFSLKLVADTLDLNAGQAVDRVGLLLGLKFPCGKELEKLASEYKGDKFKIKPTLKGSDCCLSGLENKCQKLILNNEPKEKTALYCLMYIKETLCAMTDSLLKKYGPLPLVFAGGVMSDSIIKNSIKEKYNATFALPEYSTDNAAGIAYLAYRKYKNVFTND